VLTQGILGAIIPLSPFGKQKDICSQGNGLGYSVGGFPGTPYLVQPFTETFHNPTEAKPKGQECRTDKHCIRAYEIDVKEVQKRVFDNTIPSCKSHPGTWFLSYNGSIPGPTIVMPSGHESLVRFNNKINYKTGYFNETFSPCLATNGREGRPFSVHHHGSASLPGYDGWAEDETCFGETKDYIYPNNRPATEWYHDHALHTTADNAYLGLAGMYLSSSKLKHGGCGEPWNLEGIEEKILILNDKVLDNKCQLFVDTAGVHQTNLYGDVNLVSGIPWPKMPLEPKWYRFRLLNAAVSRPWLIKVKDDLLNDVGPAICKVIAADGGYRNTPAPFPAGGLLMGVAERYEVVCDFTNYQGKSMYLWNDHDPIMMPGVVYFCNSHLLANLQIASVPTQVNPPAFQEYNTTIQPLKPINKVLSQTDLNTALQMANAGQSHRVFKFGRGNGHWTINGETWDTLRIAASDVGQNTWELWRFEAGGGWFHPVHIHLIDFYLVKRDGGDGKGVRAYEQFSPKDVFYLGPGTTTYVVARFGAHKGDYMFHCHNLVHEDNDMMRAFRVMDSAGGKNAMSAQPFIINPLNNIIYYNWAYSNPVLGETNAKKSALMPVFDQTHFANTLNKNVYKIFYPLPSDFLLMKGAEDPWESVWDPLN
jgi:FtsP/CotA-like multicopper oxidase with cupredoxin domain